MHIAMVPQKITDIAAAIDRALERLEGQLERDLSSVSRDRHPRRVEGIAAVNAVRQAADDVRAALALGVDDGAALSGEEADQPE